MLLHYIKIALRNLRKYPAQTAISVLGLAAGFVCLSLSALWMHYENTYDTMHKDYERIYALEDSISWSNPKSRRSIMAASKFKYVIDEEFPDVEATTFVSKKDDALMNGLPIHSIEVDSTYLRVFGLPLVEGSYSFFINQQEIAVTESFARKLFPNRSLGSIVGERVVLDTWSNDIHRTIAAVVKDSPSHSIFQYDVVLGQFGRPQEGNFRMVFIKTHKDIDLESLADRIYRVKQHDMQTNTKLVPISQVHLKLPADNLSYEHLRTFTFCSLLLVFCGLLNYLVLYLIRLRGRQREMALRIVNGASTRSLMVMFAIEFSIVIFAAVAFGMLFTEWLQRPFERFAGIDVGGKFVMWQAFYLMLAIAAVCIVASLIPIAFVRYRTLRRSLSAKRSDGASRKVSLFIQLSVSIIIAFCTVVMLHQFVYMKHHDWGFSVKDRAFLEIEKVDRSKHQEMDLSAAYGTHLSNLRFEAYNRVRELPSVVEANYDAADFNIKINNGWRGLISAAENSEQVEVRLIKGFYDVGNPSYGFTVLEGTLPRRDNWKHNEIVLSERVCKQLGWDTAVGRTIYWSDPYKYKTERPRELLTVVAVIKDPTPDILANHSESFGNENYAFRSYSYFEGSLYDPVPYITLIHEPGMRKEFTAEVEEVMKKHFSDLVYTLHFSEDMLGEKMKSELNLMTILGIISAVCILVAVFGVYSIVTLACAQRRKEIALRKIHGATLADILSIFIKEYGLIVLAASAVAFPIGYMIMKEWVAQYVKQAPIAWWIYAVILLAIVLLIALSVGSRVWRTARENPAEVIKRGN